ncbi:MAG TPA: hypothetical protein ENG59_07305 [Chloroflexi bacterium]|nr:hypothetical protein [Chloroflexota bacterium]
MIFPKRDAVYQNLNTSFTNFGELLVDLKENGFTGVVQVSFWEYDGVLLLDNGSVVNASQEAGRYTLSGQDAVKAVTEKAKEKDGSISVFVQSGEMITMLASMVISKAIYENLSTDFTSLEALIEKLEDQNHTGYIVVRIDGNRQTGYIFMLEGRVIDALLSAGADEVSGAKVLSRILDIISSTGATFSVFESAVEEALSESEVIRISYNLPQLLEAWGVVIQAVENSTDEHLGAGEFLNTFKDTLIANADEFPFLDPFAAKFQYQNGQVTYSGEVKKDFSHGIGKCLWETVEILAEQAAMNGQDLFGPIRSSLRKLSSQYNEQLNKFNFPGILPDLFS